MSLKGPVKKQIAMASRNAVRKSFSNSCSNWKSGTWISSANRYLLDIKTNLENDIGQNSIHHSELAEYLAASVLTHCMDGWSYLGRAIQSTLVGDNGTCRHLAYYAELRAAMAILASEGIGICNKTHFVLDEYSQCSVLDCKYDTHLIVWEALKQWSKTSQSSELITDIVVVADIPLKTWLKEFSPGFSFITRHWLSRWGLDLARFAEDEKSRNHYSYNPTAFTATKSPKISDTLAFIGSLWNLCEPSINQNFQKLDMDVLKCSLLMAIEGTRGGKQQQKATFYEKSLDRTLHNINPGSMTANSWRSVLAFDSLNDVNQVIKEAMSIDSHEAPRHHLQVLARATLLLRVAAGAGLHLIRSVPDIKRNNIAFWWKKLGLERSLWHKLDNPKNFSDMWADIGEAIDETQDWSNSTEDKSKSYYSFRNECSGSMAALGTTERIGLWSTGL